MKMVLPVLIVSVLWAGHVFAETHECSYCHIIGEKTGGVTLKAPLSALCLECHPGRKSPEEHRVDIVSPMRVDKLPLDKDGKMTCVTCHDPHGKSGHPKLLREAPAHLCQKCHVM